MKSLRRNMVHRQSAGTKVTRFGISSCALLCSFQRKGALPGQATKVALVPIHRASRLRALETSAHESSLWERRGRGKVHGAQLRAAVTGWVRNP